MYQSQSPYNPSEIRDFPDNTLEEVESAVSQAVAAQLQVAQASFQERRLWLQHVADRLEKHQEEFARLMTSEMGKTITAAAAEVRKSAWVCRHYAESAEVMLRRQLVQTESRSAWIQFDPLGIILAVMPWNFPFWQFFRVAAPSLMAGNVLLLKHASNVPGCGEAIEKVFQEAGLPSGSVTNLRIGRSTTESLIADFRIKGVTLTGSVPAGRSIASAAGKALKPHVLELGGSDPFIVLADADLDKAIKGAVQGRYQNNGQSCIASKRFIVEEPLYNRFIAGFKEAVEALKMGDPMLEGTELGPMARDDLRADLHDLVQKSINEGARLVTGGEIPQRDGWYYPATILADVVPGMAVFEEETFGPVASVTCAKTREDAFELANRSRFGLGASIWTTASDEDLLDYVSIIQAGAVSVNQIVISDPRLPFGGIKDSGYGRELSHFGIQEFVNIKTVTFGA